MDTALRDPLEAFCILLVPAHGQPRRAEELPQPARYAAETAHAFAILARRYDPAAHRRNLANPVWLGEDGAEREAALREAVTAWSVGEAPPPLRGQPLLRLDYRAIMDGVDVEALVQQMQIIDAQYPHVYPFKDIDRDPELEATFRRCVQAWEDWRRGNLAYQRLRAVLHALRDRHLAGTSPVLYVDHIHRLMGGDFKRYPFDLAPVLKPLLNRYQIHLWGACTLTEYRRTIESDSSMDRCFYWASLPSTRASMPGLAALDPRPSRPSRRLS